jgi:hypothetical protein
MKVGFKVRITGVPEGLEDFPDFPTKSTFERCVGREFVIAGFNDIGDAELGIGAVTGNPGEKIWIGARFLQIIQR